ncbi:MAG: DNA-binding protein [Planctomycetaceae bacterium]|nr:DNA-binding protein [Planctomycetaceae bacterium]
MPLDPLRTVPEIASTLRVKPHRVLAWIHAGTLPAIDLNAGLGKPSWRVRADDLDVFLAGRTVYPKVQASRGRRRAADSKVFQFF